MVNGPLWGKILKFSALYMLTTVLQNLYSVADVMVVGRFAGANALAGVGTCTVLINLFLNFILGFAAGSSIVLGQAIGAKSWDDVSKASHTAIAVAGVGGFIIMVAMQLFTKQLLNMIDVPEEVMPEASSYLRVVSFGLIPSLVYNFGAGILRAKGDTKRALYIVLVSGAINVLLNLLFVCAFQMGAAGVGLATVISQLFTAVLVMTILLTEPDETKIELKKIRIYKKPFLGILKFGLPSGIQSAAFSASNIILQSSINGFGAAAVAGSAAASSITDVYNTMVNSWYQAAIVFVSQNYGAKKFDRIKKTILICAAYLLVVWAIQGAITYFLGKPLLGLYVPKDPEALLWGWRKIRVIGFCYGLLGIMNIMSGALRGMGASFANMLTSIAGVCGIRILWIMTVFKTVGTFETLFFCYPLSWIGTTLMHTAMLTVLMRREKRKLPNCLQ